MAGYMARANAETLLIPQCETAGCLEHIEDIVAVEGVDGIFIGPFDLSIALGIPGEFADERHIAAVERVRTACERAGKLCIMFLRRRRDRRALLRPGLPQRPPPAWT